MSPLPPPPASCPTWTGIPVVCRASPFLPFTIYSSFRSQEKPLQIYVWSLHSQVCHLESSHLQLRLNPGPQPHVLATFLPLHQSAHPSRFPPHLSIAEGRDPQGPATAPGPLYLLVFTGMVVSDICLTIHTWCLLQAKAIALHPVLICHLTCHTMCLLSTGKSPGRGTLVVFIYPQH